MDIFRKFSDGYVDSYEKYLEARQLFLDTSDSFMEFLKENGDEIPKEDQKKIVDRISELDAKYDDDVLNDDLLDDDEDEKDEDGEEIDGEEIVHVLSDILELLGPLRSRYFMTRTRTMTTYKDVFKCLLDAFETDGMRDYCADMIEKIPRLHIRYAVIHDRKVS